LHGRAGITGLRRLLRVVWLCGLLLVLRLRRLLVYRLRGRLFSVVGLRRLLLIFRLSGLLRVLRLRGWELRSASAAKLYSRRIVISANLAFHLCIPPISHYFNHSQSKQNKHRYRCCFDTIQPSNLATIVHSFSKCVNTAIFIQNSVS